MQFKLLSNDVRYGQIFPAEVQGKYVRTALAAALHSGATITFVRGGQNKILRGWGRGYTYTEDSPPCRIFFFNAAISEFEVKNGIFCLN